MNSPSPPRASKSGAGGDTAGRASKPEIEEHLLGDANSHLDRAVDASDHHVSGFLSKREYKYNWYEEVEDDSQTHGCFRALTCFDRFVISESSSSRKLWELLLLVMLIYVGIVFPFRLSFCQFRLNAGDGHDCQITEEEPIWELFTLIITVFFWIDLFLNFLLTYRRDDDKEECHFAAIFVHYLSGFFWLNLLACLPPEAFNPIVELFGVDPGGCSQSGVGANQIVRISRVTRLARLTRLLRLFKIASFMRKSAMAKMMNKFRAWRLISQLCALCWVVHLLACGWYLCAAMHTEHKETWVGRREIDADGTSLIAQDAWVQWEHAMYFILTVFTTVGFGDMSAQTSGEIVYVSFVMLVGAVVHSIIISEMINLISEVDEETKWKRAQKNLFEAFGKHVQFQSDTMERLADSVNDMEVGKSAFDRDAMRKFFTSGLLPRKLLQDIPEQLFDGLLVKNKFLRSCAMATNDGSTPPRFSLLLSTMLTPAHYQAEEVVFQLNDHAFNMFFVQAGTFAYVADPSPAGGRDSVQLTANVLKLNGQRTISCKCKRDPDDSLDAAANPTSPSARALGELLGLSIDSASPRDNQAQTILRLDPPESGREYSSGGTESSLNLLRNSKSKHTPAFTSSMLGQQRSAWSADAAPGQWMQMDIGSLRTVCGVILQGHPLRNEWVSKFKVSVANSHRQNWQEVGVAEINVADHDTVVEVEFEEAHLAKIVRIEPLEWRGAHISIRAGVLVSEQTLYAYMTFGKHDYFGEHILRGRGTRSATMRCEVAGHLLLLHKEDLVPAGRGVGLLREFPQFARLLRAEAWRREARRTRMLKKLKKEWPRPAHLHYAASTLQRAWRNRSSAGDSSILDREASDIEESGELTEPRRGRTATDLSPAREGGANAAIQQLEMKVNGLKTDVCQLRSELGGELRTVNSNIETLTSAVQRLSPPHGKSATR